MQTAALLWCNTAVLHGFDICNGSVTCECTKVITHLLEPALCMVPYIYLAAATLKAPLAEIRDLQVELEAASCLI